MGEIALATAAYERTGLPTATLVNALVEKTPSKPNAPTAILARPGLANFTSSIGTAPIRCVFTKSGLLGGRAFIVLSTTAYLVADDGSYTTLSGSIPGSGLLQVDGGLDADLNSVIRIATGNALYKFVDSGTSVVAENFPTAGGAGATSVAFFAGYWLATEAGTDAMYYIEPVGTTWSALQFASAEYAPDALAGVVTFGELAALLGSATTEFWRLTGVAASPLEPAGGLKFDIGCRNINAAVNVLGTLIWVTDTCSVVLSEGGVPRIISDNGVAEQIRRTAAADISATYFLKDQHPFFVLHLGTSATWVYDVSMEKWSKFTSLGYDYWRPRLLANIGDMVIAADRLSSQFWTLDPDSRLDGTDSFTVEFCGFLDVPEGAVDIANIELDCLTGESPLTGQGSDPVIGLRLSRDGTRTWGNVFYRSMGQYGQVVTPRWTALGEARAPRGVVCKWECSDPIGRRFSAARWNVP